MKLCSEIIALAMGRGEEGLAAPPASSLALRCRLRQVSHKLLITHVHASRSHILRPARAPPFQSGTPSPTPRAPLQALQSPLPAKERIRQPRVPQTPKILGALTSLLPTPHPEELPAWLQPVPVQADRSFQGETQGSQDEERVKSREFFTSSSTIKKLPGWSSGLYRDTGG